MSWFISPARLRELGILGMNCRNIDFISRYNPRQLYTLVDDKLKTKQLARRNGIPVPPLRLVVREQYRIRQVGRWFDNLNGFAVKPTKGSGGRGILIIKGRDGEAFVKSSGVHLQPEDLKRHLSNILAGLYSLAGTPDQVMVEELISFDARFANYSYEGAPDIRVIVFQGYPVMAMLRLATRASDGKANLHQGAVGVGLDIATGRCLKAVQYSRPLSVHPDTGCAFDQIELPEWPEILRLAARCNEMTGLGYLGTDFILDEKRGPLLLELNARPGLAIQVANGSGLLPRLRRIEQLRKRHVRVEDRVRFAMEAFGQPQLTS